MTASPSWPWRWGPRLALAVLALPVLTGLWGGIALALQGGPEAWVRLATWPGLPRAIGLSLGTGLAATGIALILSLLLTAALQGGRLFRLLERALTPILALPHAAAALGLAFLIAPSGWIARVLSPWATGWQVPPDLMTLQDPLGLALILGLVVKEVPFLLLMILAALPQTDAARRMMLARTLGYGRVRGFAFTVLPALYPQLRLPVYAVLAYSMTAVESAMILGPNLPPTLSVQVVIWMGAADLSFRPVAALAGLMQGGLCLAALGLWRAGEALARRLLMRASGQGRRGARLDGLALPLARGGAIGLLALLVAGMAGLALWSFAGIWRFPDALPSGLGWQTWQRAGPELRATAGVTLALAALTTALALGLVLALLEAEQRLRPGPAPRPDPGLLPWLIYLPLVMPQVTFLPGLQAVFLTLGLGGSFGAVALLHLVFVLPYVFLTLAAPYRAWDPRLALAGAALGATASRIFWRLRLPMLLAPILTAAAVGLAVSIGQYLPTLTAGAGRIETVTTLAVALSSGGNRRLVGAYGLLQMALPALGFALALILPRWVWRRRAAMRATP